VLRAGGYLRDDVLYLAYDIVVLQLDADVADERYANGSIVETVQDLPCSQDYPPPAASTDPLRRVLLRWAGEEEVPAKTVLCTPSKSTEAWVVVALFPDDIAVRKGIECCPDAASRLGQQPLARRIRKRVSDYEAKAKDLCNAWPRLTASLDEARRFEAEFLRALPHQVK